MRISGRWTRTSLVLAVLGSLALPLAACRNQETVRPGDVAQVLPPPHGSSALIGIVALRRGQLHEALIWASGGQRRLALFDLKDQTLEVDVLGPEKAGQPDFDLLIPNAGGQSAALLDLGFKAPDTNHRGYWMDDVGSMGTGPLEDGDDDMDAAVNRVMVIVEKVYVKVWSRPMNYALKLQRSTT